MGIQVEITSDAPKATRELAVLEAALNRIKAISFNIKPNISRTDATAAASSINKIGASAKEAAGNVSNIGKQTDASTRPLGKMQEKFSALNNQTISFRNNQILANKAMMATAESSSRLERSVQSATSKFESMASAAAAFVAVGASTAGIVKMLDGITNVKTQLSLATEGQDELQFAMKQTKRIAIDTRTSINDTSVLYSKISMATQGFARSQQDVSRFVSSVSKAISMSGSSAEASSAAVIQLGQALGSNVLQGDELRSILENAPALAKALADGFGVSVGQLREMGKAGTLASEQVFRAILSQADIIDARFRSAGVTYAQSFTVVGAAVKSIGEAVQKALFSGDGKTIPEFIRDFGNSLFNVASKIEFMFLKLKTDLHFLVRDIKAFLDLPLSLKIHTFKMKVTDLMPSISEVKDYGFQLFAALKSSVSNVAGIALKAVRGYSTGGTVDGSGTDTSDDVPAMLSKDEFVVKASAARKNRSYLQAINAGAEVKHFAEGTPPSGMVEDLYYSIKPLLFRVKDTVESLYKRLEGSLSKLGELFSRLVGQVRNLIPFLEKDTSVKPIDTDKIKAPAILAVGAAVAAAVLAMTKNSETLRTIGLGLTTFGTERVLADNVKPVVSSETKVGIIEFFLQRLKNFTDFFIAKPTGINTITEGGTITKGVFIDGLFGERGFGGVIASVTRLALLFAAGRALVAGAGLKLLTAPTALTQNAAVAYQARVANRLFERDNEKLTKDTKVIDDLKERAKNAASDLAKQKVTNTQGKSVNFGSTRTDDFLKNGIKNLDLPAAAFDRETRRLMRSAQTASDALNIHEKATKESFKASQDATKRLQNLSEGLRSQVEATKAATKTAVVNAGATLGGAFGGLIGFNLGSNIAAQMEEGTSSMERVMTVLAVTMGVQMAGSLVGTATTLFATWIAGTATTLLTATISTIMTKIAAGLALTLVSPFALGAGIIAGGLALAFIQWSTHDWFAKEYEQWAKLGEKWVSSLLKLLPTLPGVFGELQNSAVQTATINANYDDSTDKAKKEPSSANKEAALIATFERVTNDLKIEQVKVRGLLDTRSLTAGKLSERTTNQFKLIAEAETAFKKYDGYKDDPALVASRDAYLAEAKRTEEITKASAEFAKSTTAMGLLERAFTSIDTTVRDAFDNFSKFVLPPPDSPLIQKKAFGGPIHGSGGPTDDLVPIMASNGEFMVTADAAKKNRPFLEAINSGKTVRAFAKGGSIGDLPGAESVTHFRGSELYRVLPQLEAAGVDLFKLGSLMKELPMEDIAAMQKGDLPTFYKHLDRSGVNVAGVRNAINEYGPANMMDLMSTINTNREALKQLTNIPAKLISRYSFRDQPNEKLYGGLIGEFGTDKPSSYIMDAVTDGAFSQLDSNGKSLYNDAIRPKLIEKLRGTIGAAGIKALVIELVSQIANAITKGSLPLGIASLVTSLDTMAPFGLGVSRGYRVGNGSFGDGSSLDKVMTFVENSKIFGNILPLIREAMAAVVPTKNAAFQKFAYGGPIRGPGGPRGDMIPLMASDGEFMVTADAAKKNRPFLEAINAGYAVRGFQDGGYIRGAMKDDPRIIGSVGFKKHQFEEEWSDAAKVAGESLGVSFKTVLAHWAHETDFGRSIIGSNNPGNMKAAKGESSTSARDNHTGTMDPYINFEDKIAGARAYAEKIKRKWPDAVGTGDDAVAFAKGLRPGEQGGYSEFNHFLVQMIGEARRKFDSHAFDASADAKGIEYSRLGKARATAEGLLIRGQEGVGGVMATLKAMLNTFKEGIIKAFPEEGPKFFAQIDRWISSLEDMFEPAKTASELLGKTYDEQAKKVSEILGTNVTGAMLKQIPLQDIASFDSLINQITTTEKGLKGAIDSGNEVMTDRLTKQLEELRKQLKSIFDTKGSNDPFKDINFSWSSAENPQENVDKFNELIGQLGESLSFKGFFNMTANNIDELKYTFVKIKELEDEIAKTAAAGGNASVSKKRLEELRDYVRRMIKEVNIPDDPEIATQSKKGNTKLAGDYVKSLQKSFSEGLTSMLSGKTTFKAFAMSFVDRLTGSIIDSFVQGFTDDLFSIALDKPLTKMFEGTNLLGSNAGSGKDGKGGVAGWLNKGFDWIEDRFPSDEKKMGLARETFRKQERNAEKGLDVSSIGETIEDSLSQGSNSLSAALTTGTDALASFGESFVKGFGSVIQGIGSFFTGSAGSGFNLSSIVGFFGGLFAAEGGLIKGPGSGTSDDVPAMLSNGEFVVNAKATKQYRELLMRINSGSMPGFSKGGMVSPDSIPRATASSSARNSVLFNINVTGDISRQTRREIQQMIPQIATGVNSHNYEQGLARA